MSMGKGLDMEGTRRRAWITFEGEQGGWLTKVKKRLLNHTVVLQAELKLAPPGSAIHLLCCDFSPTGPKNPGIRVKKPGVSMFSFVK